MAKANIKRYLSNCFKDKSIVVCVIVILGIVMLFNYLSKNSNVMESFVNTDHYYKFSEKKTVTEDPNADLLLSDWYPIHKPNAMFSNQDVSTQYKNNPVFSADSLFSNNIQKWRIPENGLCMPPGICGNVYAQKEVTYQNEPCKPPMSDVQNPRVNFYTSNPDRN
jgi:hypothetical protein